MFGQLYDCTPNEQQRVAANALATYTKTWKLKHKGAWGKAPENVLTRPAVKKVIKFPEFPEDLDLDPADAEFENGLSEFYNGAYASSGHADRTAHFATAIRSAVTARQIHKWIHRHPEDFMKWKAGQLTDGPTFLDDEAAAAEAQAAWEEVGRLLRSARLQPFHRKRASKRLEELYRRWENSVL